MLYCVANNTQDYGDNIHRCIAIFPGTSLANPLILNDQFDYVVDISEGDLGVDDPELVYIDTIESYPRAFSKNKSYILKDLQAEYVSELLDYHEMSLKEGVDLSIGFKVDCEQSDILNWMGTYVMRNIAEHYSGTIMVVDYYDNQHELTWDQYKQLCLEVGNHYFQMYQHKWNKRTEILSATSIEELEQIGYW